MKRKLKIDIEQYKKISNRMGKNLFQAGTYPDKRSYPENTALQDEINVERSREWQEENEL